MDAKMPTILENIVRSRRHQLADIASRIPGIENSSLPRSQRSLELSLSQPGAQFILECKSSSPSLGLIRSEYRPGEIARVYSRYAAAISVLCEPSFFGGDYDHLATVSASTHLPVLCKDFIIDEIQITAARYFGADAVLLMLSVLSDAEYRLLARRATELGMDILTEVVNADEARRALHLGARIIGVNHRNLHDLSIDLTRSARLREIIGDRAVVVAESGIRDHRTVRSLAAHSDAFLVGSQLTSQEDIDRACRSLIYGDHKVCGLRSPQVAEVARAAGARYGGLIVAPSSPRNVSRETSQKVITNEPGLDYIAVTTDTENWPAFDNEGFYAIQLHAPYQGSLEKEESLVKRARDRYGDGLFVWRAVSMTSPQGPQLARNLAPLVDLLVLDAHHGGSGLSFDWARVPNDIAHHCLLAGGISADHLDDALAVGTRGLDFNSGLEYPRGSAYQHHKNAALIKDIFTSIRRYANPLNPF
ncbi:bifunctional indole-3-glycerol-phosphate synthase TrpC/phosphoribosylanthranilate isomerase TrpF [Corynebacterium sp. ES2794-CONJ1]|uniref:bifunctional indole-3-glycerol-phosphate synthase TrpC/phosphoribosylanthranilate isomerase TrpF n=1 Tax=Corynebacterium sp. ES2794-CONJ1 TaxID=2980553 RepID=UPI0021DB0CE5|nr:bifunctional indole-3-glycerol-phosphate synthase TrpC/phosphoribosylanthranilate isomerase TrpF [Corynebacterium sp. ES2794-CONJ1]MCU9519778.1 bifunctional indole-3-glycerol-phosphate synthase TrpC/phosphoribosylanthranilate isomerase TrpF [Corynebacterium sp. ES2794-CONJ1]